MSITVSTIASTAGRTPRRLAALALSAALAAGTVGFVGGTSASAASPGVFNYAQCIPSYRAVIQDVEAYRSTAAEYVQVQGALVNATTGATIWSQWAVGTGPTAKASFQYSNVPKGTYHVWYHWAVWNPAKRAYVISGWVQVTGAGLNSYGYETQPKVFVGGSSGRCTV